MLQPFWRLWLVNLADVVADLPADWISQNNVRLYWLSSAEFPEPLSLIDGEGDALLPVNLISLLLPVMVMDSTSSLVTSLSLLLTESMRQRPLIFNVEFVFDWTAFCVFLNLIMLVSPFRSPFLDIGAGTNRSALHSSTLGRNTCEESASRQCWTFDVFAHRIKDCGFTQ